MSGQISGMACLEAENRVPGLPGDPVFKTRSYVGGCSPTTIACQVVWSQPTPAQILQIEACTSPERLRRYRAAVGGHREMAIHLYLADAALASHFHAHLRMVEVILREQFHRALASAYGPQWYITHASLVGGNGPSMMAAAQASLGAAKWTNPGYVVAELMLGFWASLLQTPAGGQHQQLWTDALSGAFNSRTGLPPWRRHDAMLVCKRLNWARNRVNHCESVIFGFPQKGIVQQKQLRLPPLMILEDCRRVVGRFDSDVEGWMGSSTTIADLLAQQDVQNAWHHVCADRRIVTPSQVPPRYWRVP